MTGNLLYLESSALVKLVWKEPESDALRTLLTNWPDHVSSDLAHVEVIRAAGRGPTSTRSVLQNRALEVLAAVNHQQLATRIVLLTSDDRPAPARDAIAAGVPMKRLGTPQDIAAAALFLASPAAGYITAQTLHINGGLWS